MCTRTKTLGFSLFLAAIGPLVAHAQNHHAELNQNFKFEQLTIAQGLPHNTVRCILQDSEGFLWFGTPNGLARYDGYGFKVYKHDPADSSSLSNNMIYAIHEDRSHSLWIGTDRGLNKFNRYTEKFTRFVPNPNDTLSLNAGRVWTIIEDRSGTLWFGNLDAGRSSPWGGLYKLDCADSPELESHRSRSKFKRYHHDPNNPNSLSNNAIRCMVEGDSGSLWIGTRYHGLNRFDPKRETFTRYLHDPKAPHSLGHNSVNSCLRDQNGNLWIGLDGGGMDRYDPKTGGFVHYQHARRNSNSLNNNIVTALLQDAEGMIWIANGVLSRFNPQTETFTHVQFSPTQKDWNSSYAAHHLAEDQFHNLWVGTRNSGAFKIDLKPKKFSHYAHEPANSNSLSDNDIQLIYEDQQGLLWIATRQEGLNRFDPQTEKFTHFKHDPDNPRSLSHNTVTSIYQDRRGILWIGTLAGLDQYEPQTQGFVRYQHDPKNSRSLNRGLVSAIIEDHAGTLWIGTNARGINRFDRQSKQFDLFKPDSVAGEYSDAKNIAELYEDRAGNLWVATFFALYGFDDRLKQFTRISGPLHDDPAWGLSLWEDRRGTVWGGQAGLCRLDFQKKIFKRFRPRPNPGSERSFDFSYNNVSAICEDENGDLWCGTRDGLHKFDPQKEQFVAHYSEKDGLPGNDVLGIISDDRGKLWVLTNGGLSIFDETAPRDRKFFSFDLEDGVNNTPSARRAFIKSRSGEIYWGGTNGLYRFYPQNLNRSSSAPPIRLTEFRLFNEVAKLDTSIAEIKTIRLNHDQDFFSFAFSALDFTNPLKNQYAYKLENLDRDWVQAGHKNEANYTHVPPGEYVFRVKGSNADGVWNEEGISVKIIIAPPFWQTWWFRVSIVLAIIAFLAALYNYRVAKLLEIERTRLRIARDLHDDVGSSLSSIALTAELLQKELAVNGLVNRQLARVYETAQKLSRNLKEIVWAIDPQRDKFDDLLLHMKESAEELLGQKGIAYTLEVPQEDLPHSLKMEFRRNLFLIYKEMLHNVVKHAEATKVEIMLTRINGTLQLQVSDNGRGFDEAKNGNGSGLKSMRARARELNGQLEIDSKSERGTRVQLAIRIP